MRRLFRALEIYLILVLMVLWALMSYYGDRQDMPLTLDQFTDAVRDGRIKTATILDRDKRVEGEFTDDKPYSVTYPTDYADDITNLLQEHDDIELKVDTQSTSPILSII